MAKKRKTEKTYKNYEFEKIAFSSILNEYRELNTGESIALFRYKVIRLLGLYVSGDKKAKKELIEMGILKGKIRRLLVKYNEIGLDITDIIE